MDQEDRGRLFCAGSLSFFASGAACIKICQRMLAVFHGNSKNGPNRMKNTPVKRVCGCAVECTGMPA